MSGLAHFSNENVPLYRWISLTDGFDGNLLAVLSCIGSTICRTGSIRGMRLLGYPIREESEDLGRKFFISTCFSEDTPAALRIAGLEYLGDQGTPEDIAIIQKEIEKSSYKTSGAATDALIRINIRSGVEKGWKAVLELQPERIKSDILSLLHKGIESVAAAELVAGLSHKSPEIRLMIATHLAERGLIESGTADRLLADSDARIRLVALKALQALGRGFSEEEAKGILIRKKPAKPSGLLGFFSGAPDIDGDAAYRRFRSDHFAALSLDQLESEVNDASWSTESRLAHFVLLERQFESRGEELRRAVDDRFGSVFNEAIGRMESKLGSVAPDLVQRIKKLEESERKQLTRAALDILVRLGTEEDFHRGRKLIKEGFVIYSIQDNKLFRKHGKWDDVPIIIQAEEKTQFASASLLIERDEEKYRAAADTICYLSKKHSSELFLMDMAPRLLSQVIVKAPSLYIKQLKYSSLQKLFLSPEDKVRKAIALRCIEVLPKKMIEVLLRKYVDLEGHRYYNVNIGLTSACLRRGQ